MKYISTFMLIFLMSINFLLGQIAVPTLSSPADGSTLIPVYTTLRCSEITGAGKYIYQWDTTSTFDSPICNTLAHPYSGVNIDTLKFGTTYYWRIRVTNSNDSDTSAWSTVWSFATTDGVPTLSSPVNGSTNTPVTTTLRCTSITGAGKYIYQWDTTSSFDSPICNTLAHPYSGVNIDTLKFGTTYYWRIRVTNSNDSDTSAWSTVWSFTTTDGVPTLSSPVNGSTNTPVTTTLRCTSITGAGKYIYQWDTTSSFDSPICNTLAHSYSGVNIDTLKFGTTYYWRMRVTNSSDSDTSAWSTAWSFTTTDGVPTLSSPADGSTNNPVTTTLRCSEITGVGRYIYQWDTTSSFDSPLCATLAHSYNGLSIDALKFGTIYYWRMRVTNSNESDTSAWSAVRRFTTSDAPTLISPSDGYVNTSAVRQSVSWNTITGASYYILAWDTVPTFDSPIARTYSTTSTSINITPLKFGTTYFWRVCATNSNDSDTSAWSAVRRFTTSNTPTLTSPSNGYVNTSAVKQSVSWNTITGASHYILAWDTVPTFDSPIARTYSTTSTSITITPLKFGTTYYWRVCATNSNDSDTSAWSAVRRFTTSDAPILTTPADGTAFSSYSNSRLLVKWNSITGANQYILEWDTAATFDSPLYASYATTSPNGVNISESELQYGTTYYWRVCATNSNDSDTSSWSTIWRFTTPYQLTTGPTLVSPANDSSDIDFQSALALQWDTLANVNGYRYQVSTTSSFSSLFAQGTTTQTAATIHGLRPATTYYWLVQGYNGTGNSVWSAVWHFSTNGCPPISSSLTETICESDLPYRYVNGDIDTTFEVGTPEISTFSFQFSNSYGCDSTVTLQLTVRQPAHIHDAISICESDLPYRYVNGDIDTTFEVGTPQFSTYDFRFSTSYGCDSTVTLDLTVSQPAHASQTVAECDSYFWHGTEYTQSGVYTYAHNDANGCTQADTLHLTIGHSVTVDIDTTVCDVFSWLGTSHSQSGDYTAHLHTASGCDSTVTMHVTIYRTEWVTLDSAVCAADLPLVWNGRTFVMTSHDIAYLESSHGCDSNVTMNVTVYQPVATTEDIAICESDLPYTYNDTVFEVGTPAFSTFSFRFSTQHGCDSVVTLHLTIFTADSTDFADNACGSYTWNDEVYTESGDYTQTFTNANGCDSVVTLHLTVNQSVESEFSEFACEAFVWNDELLTQSGDYTQTFTAANGCDSVVTLHLTISHFVVNELTESACDSYEWNGETYTESGDYVFEGQAANGCDSTVILHLTINQSVTAMEEVTICAGDLPYVWNDVTFNEAGTQTVTLTADNGCDSLLTMTVSVTEINTAIEIVDLGCPLGLAVYQENAEYQWMDCETNTVIAGVSDSLFIPATAGTYACIITYENCTGTTDCVYFIGNGIAEIQLSNVKVWPNPAKSVVHVECDIENAEVELYDALGKRVWAEIWPAASEQHSINVSTLTPGIYVLHVVTDGKRVGTAKVVKE